MNQFIKQISASAVKPTCCINAISNTVSATRLSVTFDFDSFYYNNESLFCKKSNTPNDVLKTLLVMESFKYETFVIRDAIRTAAKTRAYVVDIYFIPVGWLVGTDESITSPSHVTIILTCTNPDDTETAMRNLLSHHSVTRLHINHGDSIRYGKLKLENNIIYTPVAVLTFYPFDTRLLLAIVFFGRHENSHAGLLLLSPYDTLYEFAAALHDHVSSLYVIVDNMISNSVTCMHNASPVRFPATTCDILGEVTHRFIPDRFGNHREPLKIPKPYINKQLVSLIDLPSDTEISCTIINGTTVITHIGGIKLNTVLVLAKDYFMKNHVFDGTFKKRNLVWRGKYTYIITQSSFQVPNCKIHHSTTECYKHCSLPGSNYTTRTRLHVI